MSNPHVPSTASHHHQPPSSDDATSVPPPAAASTSTPPAADKGKRKRSKHDRPPGGSATSASAASDLAEASPSMRKKKDRYNPGKIAGPCTECGKRFWSWKALFGHMRCHPERQWRGINPPPNFSRSGPGETSASHSQPAPIASQSSITADERDVVHSLMMMANGQIGRGKEAGGEAAEFKCSSCKRVFGSYHALGGHRATHKNVKGCFANTIEGGEQEQEVGEVEEAAEEVMYKKLEKERKEVQEGVAGRLAMELDHHRCSICTKVFPTGQALGGHMRCHSEQKGDEVDPSSCSSTTKGCMVDLNLPPPSEMTEPKDEAHAQHDRVLDLRLGISSPKLEEKKIVV